MLFSLVLLRFEGASPNSPSSYSPTNSSNSSANISSVVDLGASLVDPSSEVAVVVSVWISSIGCKGTKDKERDIWKFILFIAVNQLTMPPNLWRWIKCVFKLVVFPRLFTIKLQKRHFDSVSFNLMKDCRIGILFFLGLSFRIEFVDDSGYFSSASTASLCPRNSSNSPTFFDSVLVFSLM